jgi:hypothetical protein
MMAKSKRLTVRLDDELDNATMTGCQNGKCDKTTVVINALRRGFGLNHPQQAGHSQPQPAGPAQASVSEPAAAKGVVKGTIRDIKYILDGERPGLTINAEVDGQRFKYCEKCNKYYRKDANGNDIF